MTGTTRTWLLTDTPASAFQAKLGRAYAAWLTFRANPLAMLGLAIVLLLVVVAALAPVIAPTSPIAQDLGARLLPLAGAGLERWLSRPLGLRLLRRWLRGARARSIVVELGIVLRGRSADACASGRGQARKAVRKVGKGRTPRASGRRVALASARRGLCHERSLERWLGRRRRDRALSACLIECGRLVRCDRQCRS